MTVRVKREKESQIEYYGAASGELLGSSAGVRTSVTITPTDDYLIIVPKNGPNKTQVEQGSFPTSYIKTEGSQVTRAADICSIDTDQFGYNQKEGTVVVEFDSNGSDGADYPRVFSLSNSAGTDLSRFLINPLNTTTVSVIKSSVGVALTGWSGSISPNAAEKVAVSMKKDSFAASLSGASSQTDTSGDMPAAADLLSIGTQRDLANNYLNGHIKSIDYYPRRLTNEQLQELTS